MLPRFEIVGRRRPVDLVSPGSVLVDEPVTGTASTHDTPHPAPYAAVCRTLDGPLDGRVSLDLASGDVGLTGWYDGARGATGLVVEVGGVATSAPQPARGAGSRGRWTPWR